MEITQSKDGANSHAETAALREVAQKTMFATPHKPHSASKKGGKESSQSE